MNTVMLEEVSRMVKVSSPLRTAESEPVLREVLFNPVSRTVDVTMTYTLREFYYILPFQVGTKMREGAIYVVPNQTV